MNKEQKANVSVGYKIFRILYFFSLVLAVFGLITGHIIFYFVSGFLLFFSVGASSWYFWYNIEEDGKNRVKKATKKAFISTLIILVIFFVCAIVLNFIVGW